MEELENMGITPMAKELKRLNPSVQFDVRDLTVSPIIVIFGTVPGEDLILPEGYYYNEKNGITNKHNTASGVYEGFEYQYDMEHFAPKSQPKKSVFARIFARIFAC